MARTDGERIASAEDRIADLEQLVRALTRQAQIDLGGLARRLERCKITESAGPGDDATAKLVDQDDEPLEHREITVHNTSLFWPLVEDQLLDVTWRQLPGTTTKNGLWIPLGDVAPRILRVVLTEDLEIDGSADSVLAGNHYEVHDEDRWPIPNGRHVLIYANWDPDGGDDGDGGLKWAPLKAERAATQLISSVCCGDTDIDSCKVTGHLDFTIDEDDDCSCEGPPGAAETSYRGFDGPVSFGNGDGYGYDSVSQDFGGASGPASAMPWGIGD